MKHYLSEAKILIEKKLSKLFNKVNYQKKINPQLIKQVLVNIRKRIISIIEYYYPLQGCKG